ncbi:hypothetical protein BD779DRAFT_913141 [Infundibulicybe gibba]|nr:hypothetical protein BD779DRAFT_913141 [Infundibulicybe gibba]
MSREATLHGPNHALQDPPGGVHTRPATIAERIRRTCKSGTKYLPLEHSIIYLCVDFQIQKILRHLWISCDACGREIIHTRTLCATCVNVDLSDNIDLCSSCIHQTPSRGKFNHDVSHILVQTDRVLHDYNLAWIIREANVTVGRVKSNLQDLQKPPQYIAAVDTHGTSHATRSTSEMLCSCCRKAVTAPFWVCVECSESIHPSF